MTKLQKCRVLMIPPVRDPDVSLGGLLWRGLRLRCPRCGGRGLSARFLRIVPNCPSCGHHFEREQGYWIGAMIIATALTLAAFLAVFVGGMVITWPDVPWTGILVATLTVTTLVPVLGYPLARTIWIALDLRARPLEPGEIERAAQNQNMQK